MMASPFSAILRDAVERTPGAVGGSFAASDGEMVDWFARRDPAEWAVLTAHNGVLFAHVQSALHTFHYGDAELLVISFGRLAVLVRAVADGYFALLGVTQPAAISAAITAIERAAAALREEM